MCLKYRGERIPCLRCGLQSPRTSRRPQTRRDGADREIVAPLSTRTGRRPLARRPRRCWPSWRTRWASIPASKHLMHGAAGRDPSLVHHHGRIDHQWRHQQVVADDQDRLPLGGKRPRQPVDLQLMGQVEMGVRLVQEQDAALLGQGAGDHGPLALPAAEAAEGTVRPGRRCPIRSRQRPTIRASSGDSWSQVLQCA